MLSVVIYRSTPVDAMSPEFEADCRALLDRFFATCPDATMHERALMALRLLRASEEPLKGNAKDWAAGIIYFVTTDGRFPCGVPGVLNAEFEQFMGITMGTARYRAARVREIVIF
ncbi:MAG: hypothetical protein ACHRHE_19995 [Tepidisphaerales bacterium]